MKIIGMTGHHSAAALLLVAASATACVDSASVEDDAAGSVGGKSDESTADSLARFEAAFAAGALIEVGRLTVNSAADPGWEVIRALDVPADAITLSTTVDGPTTRSFMLDGNGLGYWIWQYRHPTTPDSLNEVRYLVLTSEGQEALASEDQRLSCTTLRPTNEYCAGARVVAAAFADGQTPTEAQRLEFEHSQLFGLRLDNGELLMSVFASTMIEGLDGDLGFLSVRIVRDALRN